MKGDITLTHIPKSHPGFVGWVVELTGDGYIATNRDDPRVTLEAPTMEGIKWLINMREGKHEG